MTEAEKAQFYATIMAGLLSSREHLYLDTITGMADEIAKAAIDLGDELRAQLIERRGPEF